MNRAGRIAVKMACLGAVVSLSASPSLPIERVTKADIERQLGSQLSASLDDMSTGTDQDVFLTGNDAQSRNLRIPIVAGATRRLIDYAPMRSGSAGYAQALECMTQAIYYEAANEPRSGKHAVAQVVLNRMRHPAFPNSVCGVIYQGVNDRVCQFSFTCDGALLRTPLREQWRQSEEVARDALSGVQMAEVGTATHYHADYVVPRWAYTLTKLEVVGTHIFYRFPGSAGEPVSFSQNWTRSERIPEIDWSRYSPEPVAPVETPIEDTWVPGLTVTPDETDRHAVSDVGGRLDTTKQWRLSIPDPVAAQESYRAAVEAQAETGEGGNE